MSTESLNQYSQYVNSITQPVQSVCQLNQRRVRRDFVLFESLSQNYVVYKALLNQMRHPRKVSRYLVTDSFVFMNHKFQSRDNKAHH